MILCWWVNICSESSFDKTTSWMRFIATTGLLAYLGFPPSWVRVRVFLEHSPLVGWFPSSLFPLSKAEIYLGRFLMPFSVPGLPSKITCVTEDCLLPDVCYTYFRRTFATPWSRTLFGWGLRGNPMLILSPPLDFPALLFLNIVRLVKHFVCNMGTLVSCFLFFY